jgi:hypothetical protein
LLLAAAAQAQVFAVSFKDEKVARKYKHNLVLINGESVVVGEGKYAIFLDDKSIKYNGSGKNELWVADPGDPTFVPYKYKNDERIPASPKGVLDINGEHIRGIRVLIQEQSLAGLSKEYADRMARITEINAERSACVKGSREWFMAHQRLISQYERLQKWMSSTCYPEAAKKLEKEIERQRKNVTADALAERLSAAKATIHAATVGTDLAAAAESATNGRITFKVQESMHARIIYRTEITDERVQALLEFAEEAIDGFRGDCVDPYLDVDFEDKIPDRMFIEWCFGPDDVSEWEKFGQEYYRIDWTKNREERLKVSGTGLVRAIPPEAVHYWKYEETTDLEGIVAHNLGHDLTLLHYNLSLTKPVQQDWLFEGVAFYLSLEVLGRNSVTCREFKDTKYVHENKQKGERSEQMGLRDYYNAIALDNGPPIDKLATRELYSFEDADVAKAWSFYDFLVKKEGKKGQLFLRAACQFANDKATFIQKWRDKCNIIYDVESGDVFKAIDTRWREFAETGQETGDTSRRKG